MRIEGLVVAGIARSDAPASGAFFRDVIGSERREEDGHRRVLFATSGELRYRHQRAPDGCVFELTGRLG